MSPQSEALILAGRAYEAGDLALAEEILSSAPESPSALLLRARVAFRSGNAELAVNLYHQLTDIVPTFEPLRIEELARALAATGRYGEAISQLESLLRKPETLSTSNRFELLETLGLWSTQNGDQGAAVEAFQRALSLNIRGPARDRMSLKLAIALAAHGESTAAIEILRVLALKAGRAAIMNSALLELEKLGKPPVWSDAERLQRARTFVAHRSFNNADASLEPLVSSKDAHIREDARWLRARILFDRRKHYREAIVALEPIAQSAGKYADEAELLWARSLSRLNRDEEAIAMYKQYSRRSKNRIAANHALYSAARLEFYLGKHRPALFALEKIVGTGKKIKKNTGLNPSSLRDAHYLAGMSALQLKLPAEAAPHFIAASRGTSDDNVSSRNRYWHAVARMETRAANGPDLLRDICERDPTSWYARLSAARLVDSGEDAAPCELHRIRVEGSSVSSKPLSELSTLSAFLAEAGFYREAANELKKVERSAAVNASTEDWVLNYVALDAPHHAIRRASLGLSWPPKAEDYWRVKAAYPSPYFELVKEVEEKHGLLRGFVYAIARKESLFDPMAVSPVGALGMMQMMPATYEYNRKKAGLPELKKGEIPGPEASIRAAGFELEQLLKKFNNSVPLAIMAYNAGPTAVDHWLARSGDLPLDVFVEKAGFSQTRNYVKRVIRNLVRYSVLARAPVPKLPAIAARLSALDEEDDVKE